MKPRKDSAKEDGAELLVLAVFVIVFLFALVWFLASHKLVYTLANPLRWLALPYALIDSAHWDSLNRAAEFYRERPRDVGFLLWLRYVNACLLPSAALLSLGAVVYAAHRTLGGGGDGYKRRFEPMAVAREISGTFQNILPVLHLGPDLMADRLPLWRRQTFPEEIWQSEKINGRPLVAHGRLDLEATHTYFRGGERAGGPPQMRSSRRWSRTLGYQVVDLIIDAPVQQSVCFPDRFSPQGKVLFGLLAAHAFGGRPGKEDYRSACDQLNRTCAGQANGLPNLTAAQWIYTKYRMHSSARALFALHHWEYTYLFALFGLAKRNGKATHTDWIWLKPLDRVLFYVLNTVGRATPHAESAAAFAMVDYETKCAQNKRLPMLLRNDGKLEHHIHVLPAVEAFAQEFERWNKATNDDEDWWRKLDTWRGAQAFAQQAQELAAVTQQHQAAQVELLKAGPPEETPFDLALRAQLEQEDRARLQQGFDQLQAAFAAAPARSSTGQPARKEGDSGNLDFLD